MECLNCHNGMMLEPEDQNVSYVRCNNCGAVELTYEPQDYQEEIHTVPYRRNKRGQIRMHIVGAFGGKKSHSHR